MKIKLRLKNKKLAKIPCVKKWIRDCEKYVNTPEFKNQVTEATIARMARTFKE